MRDYFLQNKIEWRFILPRLPHHGGLWKAAVKRTEFYIYRLVGKLNLAFEELSTLFCQVEAVLNSWPSIPISVDPDDLHALTPGPHWRRPYLNPPNRLAPFTFEQSRFKMLFRNSGIDGHLNIYQLSKLGRNGRRQLIS
ncbi:hypothetical protein JTB14_026866 [Gonioctena quinquepunctata]|nr:hypothetical protein JTB14_026866 [Gonioctena quinquepunctata]